jgi:hypothetical protein
MNDKLEHIKELLDKALDKSFELGVSESVYDGTCSNIRLEIAGQRTALLAAIADLAPKWRPVGDPPEKSCRVLLTLEMQNQRVVVEGVYSPAMGFEFWDEDGDSKDLFSAPSIDEDESDDVNIVAWQPMPALYDGQA